jgi:hypothetical protein
MNRKILKSDGAFVLIGDSPSWKTSSETGRLFSLVQNLSFGLQNDRQKLKQVGYENYAVNHINKSPDINLNINYYLTPYLHNELQLGFNLAYSSDEAFSIKEFRSNRINTLLDESITDGDDNFTSNNFYVIIDNNQLRDAITEAEKTSPASVNFSGFDVVSFGNCYLTNYQLSYSVGSIPTVSTSYLCSNMKFDNLTGNVLTIPAINPVSGNSNNAGTLNLSSTIKSILTGDFGYNNVKASNLPVATHRTSTFTLQDLQCGGVALKSNSNPILQNLNINLDFTRTNLYGFGSNYPFDRKLEFPVNATVELQALVSGVSSGFISGMMTNESNYRFNISFSEVTPNKVDPTIGYITIENAKLENFNYSMSVNDIMNFSASFSVELSNDKNFYFGRAMESDRWRDVKDLWSVSNITWQ